MLKAAHSLPRLHLYPVAAADAFVCLQRRCARSARRPQRTMQPCGWPPPCTRCAFCDCLLATAASFPVSDRLLAAPASCSACAGSQSRRACPALSSIPGRYRMVVQAWKRTTSRRRSTTRPGCSSRATSSRAPSGADESSPSGCAWLKAPARLEGSSQLSALLDWTGSSSSSSSHTCSSGSRAAPALAAAPAISRLKLEVASPSSKSEPAS